MASAADVVAAVQRLIGPVLPVRTRRSRRLSEKPERAGHEREQQTPTTHARRPPGALGAAASVAPENHGAAVLAASDETGGAAPAPSPTLRHEVRDTAGFRVSSGITFDLPTRAAPTRGSYKADSAARRGRRKTAEPVPTISAESGLGTSVTRLTSSKGHPRKATSRRRRGRPALPRARSEAHRQGIRAADAVRMLERMSPLRGSPRRGAGRSGGGESRPKAKQAARPGSKSCATHEPVEEETAPEGLRETMCFCLEGGFGPHLDRVRDLPHSGSRCLSSRPGEMDRPQSERARDHDEGRARSCDIRLAQRFYSAGRRKAHRGRRRLRPDQGRRRPGSRLGALGDGAGGGGDGGPEERWRSAEGTVSSTSPTSCASVRIRYDLDDPPVAARLCGKENVCRAGSQDRVQAPRASVGSSFLLR